MNIGRQSITFQFVEQPFRNDVQGNGNIYQVVVVNQFFTD